MPTTIPEISSRLREKTVELAADLSPIVDRTFAILTPIDGYRSLAPAVKRDVSESVGLAARVWFEALLSGEPLSARDADVFREIGRRRVHQRVPLPFTLHAVRIGLREIWRTQVALGEADGELANELLFKVSPFLFDYFDLVAQAIVQAYLAEQYDQAGWRESLLHQLYSIVFHSPGDVEGFRATAEGLGMDFAAPRIALAIDTDVVEHGLVSREDVLDRIVLAAARHLNTAPGNLVRAWHRQRLILWVPCPLGDSVSRGDRLVTQSAKALASALPQLRHIGIGLMNEGPAGWAASVEEAMRALDFAKNDGARDRVRSWTSIVVEEGARRADNARRYLASLLDQLSNESGLLSTLETYFAKGQRRGKTADALNIHPNTLNYRIERIEALLGASLDDVSWVAKLNVALQLRHTA
ncbi:PucR family transcriptional regulator [Paraburkholderia sp. 35.1]|uniref:PucR family transcriptional regulator n=1 Tax=unclassified Paraburkholderia TaxID=2615204 RepID=UPI003D1C05BC